MRPEASHLRQTEALLCVPRPTRSFILWEHLLRSAVAFIGTFALLFFGPLMLGSRKRTAHPEDTFAYAIMKYILDHPEVHAGISVLAVVIVNIYLVIKNRRIKYVVKIEAGADSIRLEKTDLYYSRTEQVVIPAADFELYVQKSVTQDNERHQKIVFRNARENKTVGEINPQHIFWSDHLVQVKHLLRTLGEFRKEDVTTTGRGSGIGGLFRR